ncbi:MAG: hypothetical protein IT429_25630 [Gemmataceae bacterium]|nr:hypothetical protein [Gemmataceae bacterium]
MRNLLVWCMIALGLILSAAIVLGGEPRTPRPIVVEERESPRPAASAQPADDGMRLLLLRLIQQNERIISLLERRPVAAAPSRPQAGVSEQRFSPSPPLPSRNQRPAGFQRYVSR